MIPSTHYQKAEAMDAPRTVSQVHHWTLHWQLSNKTTFTDIEDKKMLYKKNITAEIISANWYPCLSFQSPCAWSLPRYSHVLSLPWIIRCQFRQRRLWSHERAVQQWQSYCNKMLWRKTLRFVRSGEFEFGEHSKHACEKKWSVNQHELQLGQQRIFYKISHNAESAEEKLEIFLKNLPHRTHSPVNERMMRVFQREMMYQQRLSLDPHNYVEVMGQCFQYLQIELVKIIIAVLLVLFTPVACLQIHNEDHVACQTWDTVPMIIADAMMAAIQLEQRSSTAIR